MTSGMETPILLEKRLEDLYALIDGIATAMVTTRRTDGRLVSRPMKTQRRTTGTDLWFVTNVESEGFEDLAKDPQVNLAYLRDRTGEWVSVSGQAMLARDRDIIDSLYKPEWKAWFPDEGDGKRTGGPHDPRIALILVEAQAVTYSRSDKPMPLVLFEAAKSRLMGEARRPTEPRSLSARELTKPRVFPDLR